MKASFALHANASRLLGAALSTASICVLTLGVLTGSAHATDAKTYSHVDCFSDAAVTYTSNEITATGAGTTLIYCPIIRRNLFDNNGLADLNIRVYDPGAGSVECTVYATDSDGESFDTAIEASAGSGVDDLLDFGTALNSSGSLGSYYISCDVPQNGKIHNYTVVEEDGFDLDNIERVHSHTDCVSTSGVSYSGQNVTATGAGGATIRCSFPRIAPNGYVTHVYVKVYDPGASAVQCELFAADADGEVFDSIIDTSAGSGVDDTLDFGTDDETTFDEFDDGPLFFTCVVPQNGQIQNYYVEEFEL